MPDADKFERIPSLFTHGGVNLNAPADSLPANAIPLGRNIRAYSTNTIQQRPGLNQINVTALGDLNIHSGRLLNNPLSGASQTYAVFLGAGDELYSDNSAHTAFTSRASGFSGNPLFFMPMEPVQTIEPYIYVGDSLKLSKAKVDGTAYNWGIAAPNTVPTVELAQPLFKSIDDMNAATFGDWVQSAGVLTNPDRLAAVVISNILYDSGSTGWCLVNPASMADIREEMFITMSVNAETVPIDSIYKAVTTTTISSIKYVTGTSGLCTVQLTDPTAELQRNSMLRIAAAENVRVLSVTYGADGIPSFTCVTTGTRSAGDAVAGLDAFRVYFANAHTTADTISTKMLNLVTAAAGITTLTRIVTLDLSTISSRPVTPEDFMSIQVQMDNPALIDKDIQIVVDVDSATAAVADVGTKNYYFYNIRAADLQPAATQTLADITVAQRIAQRDQLDITASPDLAQKLNQLNPDEVAIIPGDVIGSSGGLTGVADPVTQTVPGLSQWTVLTIPISGLLANRAGSDQSRSLKNVMGIRISFSATAIVTVKADAWWIGGTYGPNTDSQINQSVNAPYLYGYRYRSSTTGAKSALSPPTRSGLEVARGKVICTPTVSSDAQVDKIDWFRFGGTLNGWFYLGTQANSGTFSDIYADDVIDNDEGRLPVDVDGISLDLQPFPVLDVPRTGTCDVVGTEITRVSGDTFNTSWIRNNPIVIDGVPCTLYAQPTSTSRGSLNENIGTKTGVTFYLPSPTMAGQPLDAYFGPWGEGEAGVTLFGLKNGTLYWTNGNDPDSCAKGNYLEATSASEPLMNGCIFDGRPFLFSTERMWEIQPDPTAGFLAKIIVYAKGLYARWALTVGDVIYYAYKDGLYQWPGGSATAGLRASSSSITDDAMYPLFPHDGQVGIAVNGVDPPDFSNTTALRLDYSDSELYFDCIDTGAVRRSFVRSGAVWIGIDTYAAPAIFHFGAQGIGIHRLYVGATDGHLYTLLQTALSDSGTPFTSLIRTPAVNSSDPRARKILGDCYAELNAVNGESVTVTPYVNNYATAQTVSSLTGSGSRDHYLINLVESPQEFVYNLGLEVSWPSSANTQLFVWEYTCWHDTFDRNEFSTPDYTQGLEGFFILHRGYVAHTSSSDITLSVYLNGSDTAHSTYTISNGGGLYTKTPVMLQPIKAKSVRFRFESDDPFRLYNDECEWFSRSWLDAGGSLQPLRLKG